MKIKTWDGHNINDSTNYTAEIFSDAYGLPAVDVTVVKRESTWPAIAGVKRPGKQIFISIVIRGSSVATLQKQLNQWFDPDDETPKRLVVEDDSGGNDRYVLGICERLSTISESWGSEWIATITVDSDAMWRETTPSAASSWSITASGQTKVVTNSGQMDCYPILKIKPTSSKTGGYPYKRFMAVIWRAGEAVTDYPVDIANDSLDTQIASTHFALASGYDLRVFVDGAEVDRWLDGPNTSTTKVWVNLDFEARIDLTVAIAMGSGDTQMTVNENIKNMPETGILKIDSELISYAAKDNASKKFTGLTRGAKGTTAATHTASTTVSWVQHDIWIVYGNSGASEPRYYDATKQPMFTLSTSTNTSWDYDDFNDIRDAWPNIYNRTAHWLRNADDYEDYMYTALQDTMADPQSVLGLKVVQTGIASSEIKQASYYLINPCGLTNANFQNGYKRASNLFSSGWSTASTVYARITTDLGVEYDITQPTAANTWESWSRNEALTTGATKIVLALKVLATIDAYIEASDVTLTLNSAKTPTTAIGSEQGNYSLDCTITNTTHPDTPAIKLTFTMQLNEELQVDTSAKTITYLDDNSAQFQALTLIGGARRDWLPLIAGNNTLRFDDTGTNAVTISITYEERSYQ